MTHKVKARDTPPVPPTSCDQYHMIIINNSHSTLAMPMTSLFSERQQHKHSLTVVGNTVITAFNWLKLNRSRLHIHTHMLPPISM